MLNSVVDIRTFAKTKIKTDNNSGRNAVNRNKLIKKE